MKTRTILGSLLMAVLVTVAVGPGRAQGPGERAQPQGALSIEASVAGKFSYQGMLREDGVPVSGRRDMVFQLFTGEGCTLPYGDVISIPDVEVSAGLFSVELSFNPYYFYGVRVWLGIQVDGTTVGCQEILPVPYALSLKPGAWIQDSQEDWQIIHAVNTASIGRSYGLLGWSRSPDGAGVLAKGVENGADLILAGDSSSQDNGTICSDPAYPSSDIVVRVNDTVRIDLDDDGDGEDADFEIRDKDDNLIFDVDDGGAVVFGGAGIAAFPRPAYDSGWVALSQSQCEVLTHGLGGSVDNYVVDIQLREGSSRHIMGLGGLSDAATSNNDEGGWWRNLTTTSVEICRNYSDYLLDSIRIRIWVYP
jgi:hypothetical protein